MALNIKTLLTRSITGIVFVMVLLSFMLWNYYSFSLFFFVVAMIGLYEFYKISGKLNAKPLIVPGYVFAVLLYLSNCLFDFDDLGLNMKMVILGTKISLALGFILIFTGSILSRKENAIHDALFTIGGVIYVVLPLSLLNQLVFNVETGYTYDPKMVLGIILLIWCNDTFAYLGGSLFGKRKLIERISPGKTWEGTFTGIILSFALSFLLNTLLIPLPNYLWMIMGVLVPIFATLGDLIESKLKREADVKDSGKLMPGHGGILDRFDSLLLVSPMVYLLLLLLKV
ncbi:MAG: phosphatidate cytidylyltransferase [Sphingobacteriaceae bacterium]|nr:phosphatidate cytidylyltransferase [Sphingobacteriaceae bacterium]